MITSRKKTQIVMVSRIDIYSMSLIWSVKAISRGRITALRMANMIMMISQINFLSDFYGIMKVLGSLASSSSLYYYSSLSSLTLIGLPF